MSDSPESPTNRWECISCKKKSEGYKDAYYLCICPRNQLVCKTCVSENKMEKKTVDEMFGRGHYARDVSGGVNVMLRDMIRKQQKRGRTLRYMEHRKSSGWVHITPQFFHPHTGRRPSTTQHVQKVVMFHDKYQLDPFVDVLTQIIVEAEAPMKIGVFVGDLMCKKGRIKKGKSVIPFYAPLFALGKKKVGVKLRPKNKSVSIAIRGFIVTNRQLKRSLLHERLWVPESKLVIEKGEVRMATPEPLPLQATMFT